MSRFLHPDSKEPIPNNHLEEILNDPSLKTEGKGKKLLCNVAPETTPETVVEHTGKKVIICCSNFNKENDNCELSGEDCPQLQFEKTKVRYKAPWEKRLQTALEKEFKDLFPTPKSWGSTLSHQIQQYIITEGFFLKESPFEIAQKIITQYKEKKFVNYGRYDEAIANLKQACMLALRDV